METFSVIGIVGTATLLPLFVVMMLETFYFKNPANSQKVRWCLFIVSLVFLVELGFSFLFYYV